VSDESTRGLAGVEIPETESVIPRCGEGKLAIGGDDDVRDEVVVSVQNAFWISVCILVTGQLPDNDSLVCVRYGLSKQATVRVVKKINTTGGSQDHVWVL
jgi:hypothetical protein